MAVVTMNELLDAGVHFGHKTQRWNPKMRPYIFGVRNEIHIFDLQHTVRAMENATAFLTDTVSSGGRIIYVGTKRQAKDTIRACASDSGQYYVTERWLGGTLTNFETIKQRLQRLRELRSRAEAGELDALSKRDAHLLNIEMARLERKMGGIANMTARPEALVVVDPRRESIAVREAQILGIPVVALTDSNCDPDDVEIVIPGNDDSIRSIRLILGLISDTVQEAFESYESHRAEREDIERAERERLERVRREMAIKRQGAAESERDAAGKAAELRATKRPVEATPKAAAKAPAAEQAAAKAKPAADAAKSKATAKGGVKAKAAAKVSAKPSASGKSGTGSKTGKAKATAKAAQSKPAAKAD